MHDDVRHYVLRHEVFWQSVCIVATMPSKMNRQSDNNNYYCALQGTLFLIFNVNGSFSRVLFNSTGITITICQYIQIKIKCLNNTNTVCINMNRLRQRGSECTERERERVIGNAQIDTQQVQQEELLPLSKRL